MTNSAQLGIYVHWPFCTRLCPYCDFNIYKNREIDAARWSKALVSDLEYWATRIERRPLTSLYFGGGTPSLAPASVIADVVDACERLFGFEENAEITLEANPTDAEQSNFNAFAQAGINRLSLGVQSLRDDALEFLGRNHSAAAALTAIETARALFPRITFDLIYGRPDQSLDQWQEELSQALAFDPAHLSLYQLTIEPGTAFASAVEKGRWSPLSSDQCADFFEVAQRLTNSAGLRAYEISNHAAPGEQSRHNLLYWTYQDYIGIGPGAHGRLQIGPHRIATEAFAAPETYLQVLEKTGSAITQEEELTDEAQLTERLAMGLRLTDGIDLFADDFFYEDENRVSALHTLTTEGFLSHNCGRLRATEKGRPLLNTILRELLA